MNLTEAIEQVSQYEAQYHEHRFPLHALRVADGFLYAGEDRFTIGDEGLGRFCKTVHAPSQYLRGLDIGLQSALLQRHLDKGDAGRAELGLFTRGNEFLGFRNPTLARLHGADVLQAVAAGTERDSESLSVHNLRFDEDSFEIEILSPVARHEILPDDVVRAGVRVTNSTLGEYAVRVEAFLLRLVCTNGLTHRECVARKATRTRRLPAHRTDAIALQRDQVSRLTAEVWRSLRDKLHAMTALTNERLEVPDVLRRWIERARLSVRELLPTLLTAWETEGRHETAWGAVNALTRVATHNAELTTRQRRSLAGLAGILAFRHSHLCPRCFSVLGSVVNEET